MNKNSLPYFQIKNKEKYLKLYLFLRRKFQPTLKRKYPSHYLVSQNPRLYIKFLKQVSKTYPYFLYLDVSKYFPSIKHSLLLAEIKSNY